MLNRTLWLLAVVMVLVSAVTVSAAELESPSFTIKVQANGDVRVTPDMAQLWIGVRPTPIRPVRHWPRIMKLCQADGDFPEVHPPRSSQDL